MVNLSVVLDDSAREEPNRAAIVLGPTRLTYAQVNAMANQVANALVARGVASGQLRQIDPEMTVRSIIGPIIAHVALSEVFGLRPEEGLALDRLVANHLDVLFHGISPAGGEETP